MIQMVPSDSAVAMHITTLSWRMLLIETLQQMDTSWCSSAAKTLHEEHADDR